MVEDGPNTFEVAAALCRLERMADAAEAVGGEALVRPRDLRLVLWEVDYLRARVKERE